MASFEALTMEFLPQDPSFGGDTRAAYAAAPQEVVDAEFAGIVEGLEAERTPQEVFAGIVDKIGRISPELQEALDVKLWGKDAGADGHTTMKN